MYVFSGYLVTWLCFLLHLRQILLPKTCWIHVKVKLHTISTCSSSDTRQNHCAYIAPLTASEKQRIRQRRFHSVPPVNHCHNRGLIISVMICLEKQPWGNQSENSQLASQNNFCTPSPDCRMLLQPSVSVIKTFHRLLEQVVADLNQLSDVFFFFLLIHGLSGPMRAYVLAREDGIRHWRELMGPTKVFRARYTSPASIRGQFGLTDTRNTTHGSGRECIMWNSDSCQGAKKNELQCLFSFLDSVESAQREISFFFPDFSAEEWMEKEEPWFRSGHFQYDHEKETHIVSPQSWPPPCLPSHVPSVIIYCKGTCFLCCLIKAHFPWTLS